MNSTLIIAIVFTLTMLSGTLIYQNINEFDNTVKMAESGLEQCLKDPNTFGTQTLWNKDCSTYYKALKLLKD